jgi:hypothetical protein
MSPPAARLPKNLPDGTKYVVEGRSGAEGVLHVLARYVVLPDGRRVDLPVQDLHGLTAARPALRRTRSRPRFAAKTQPVKPRVRRRAAA